MIISNNINNNIKQKQTSIGQNKQEKKSQKNPQEILIDAETQSFIYTETPLKPENWKT